MWGEKNALMYRLASGLWAVELRHKSVLAGKGRRKGLASGTSSKYVPAGKKG